MAKPKPKKTPIPPDQFHAAVMLAVADVCLTHRVREWEEAGKGKEAEDYVKMERKFLVDPDDVRECARRVAEVVMAWHEGYTTGRQDLAGEIEEIL